MIRDRQIPKWIGAILALLWLAAGAVAQPAASDKVQFNTLLKEGSELVQKKDYDGAIGKFEAAERLRPNNAHVFYRLADVYRRQRNWDKATEYGRKSLELQGDARTWQLLRECARQYLQNKEWEKCWAVMECGLRYKPDDLTMYDWSVQALYNMKDLDRAIEWGEKGLAVFLKYHEDNPGKKVYVRGFVPYLANAYFDRYGLQAYIARFVEERKGRAPTEAERCIESRFNTRLGEGLLAETRYEAAIEVLQRARALFPADVEAHRQYARAVEKADGRDAAIEALRESLKDLPDNSWLLNELANYLYSALEYKEARALYTKLIDQTPTNRWWIEREIACLTNQKQYDEAQKVLTKRIATLREKARENPGLRHDIEMLESRTSDLLDRSGALDQRMAALRAALQDQPTSAPLHNQLAEYYLQQGHSLLALSHYLQAAWQTGNADALAAQTASLTRARRDAEAMPYVQAMIDHFPSHGKMLEIVEQVVQMRGLRGRRRFALTEDQLAALAVAETACRHILQQTDISAQTKVDATIAALRYHYEALPNEPGLWMKARAEAAALLNDNTLNEKQRARVMEWMADIDWQRLENSQAAYDLLLDAAKLNPDVALMDKLADVALNITPRPNPAPLREFVAAQGQSMRTARLKLKLLQWLWDRGEPGERDEAVKMFSEEVTRFRGNTSSGRGDPRAGRSWEWFLDQLRRTRPELLKRAWHEGTLPTANLEAASQAELVTQQVWLVATPGANPTDPVIRFDQTVLTIPAEWGAVDRVSVRATRRPVGVSPPAFFSKSDDGAWHAEWWPAEPSVSAPPQIDTMAEDEQAAESVRISLESRHDLVPNHGLTVRRTFVDEGDEANSILHHVYVQSREPYTVRIYPDRTNMRSPRDIDPAWGSYDSKAAVIAFEDPALLATSEGGTTFTFRTDRPNSWNSNTYAETYPVVDIVIGEKTSEIALDTATDARKKACWMIDDTGREYRFELEVAGGGIVQPGSSTKLTRRTLVRMTWGRRPL